MKYRRVKVDRLKFSSGKIGRWIAWKIVLAQANIVLDFFQVLNGSYVLICAASFSKILLVDVPKLQQKELKKRRISSKLLHHFVLGISFFFVRFGIRLGFSVGWCYNKSPQKYLHSQKKKIQKQWNDDVLKTFQPNRTFHCFSIVLLENKATPIYVRLFSMLSLGFSVD